MLKFQQRQISRMLPIPSSCMFLGFSVLPLTYDKIHVSPPLSWYSRKPVLFLPAAPPSTRGSGGEGQQEDFDDSLDRHVNDVLQRRFKFRRTIRGIWSFLKTRRSNFLPWCFKSQPTLQPWG